MSDAPFHVHLVSIFPEYFESPLNTSLQAKAIERGLLKVDVHNVREFSEDKHNMTDDLPYGGGAGMVMTPQPAVSALEHAREISPDVPRLYMTPQGEPLTQALAQELSEGPGMIIMCGRYEGLDYRVREGWIDREICIGDFVLTGGEPAALIVLNSVMRLLPGVLGNAASIEEESFSANLLEHPHYTRPRSFRGMDVPEVLLNGNHAKIDAWRREQSEAVTRARRPDLWHRDHPVEEDS